MVSEAAAQLKTPEVKARKLRGALRGAREQAGLTQQAAAEYLSWSPSRLARVEQGSAPLRPDDVRELLDLYAVGDDERVLQLARLAELTAERSWGVYADIFGDDALDLFRNESSADVISKFEPTFMPGAIQTDEYAQALLVALGHSPHQIMKRLEVLCSRREMFQSSSGPRRSIVLGEAALSRPVGGPLIMRRQVEQLKRFAALPWVSLQILPFAVGSHPAIGKAFTILHFNDSDLSDLLFLEDAHRRSKALETGRIVARHRKVFEQLQRVADAPTQSEAIIDRMVTAALVS